MINKFGGKWISLDGTECVGKTYLFNYLKNIYPDYIYINEFSNRDIGKYLQNMIMTNSHKISKSILEQTFLFLADFLGNYEISIKPNLEIGKVVISDRGYISKFVYQYGLLIQHYHKERSYKMLQEIFNMISVPDLSILLYCDIEEQKRRIIMRDNYCQKNRLENIKVFNNLIIDTSVKMDLNFVKLNSNPTGGEIQFKRKAKQILNYLLNNAI